MPKGRFTTADVAAMCGCLQARAAGFRLQSVYDVDGRTYLLKLAKSGAQTADGEGEKLSVLLESGVRFHSTKFSWNKNDAPSNFSLKLRKHLKNRRLEAVRQLGMDRIVDFVFGTGDLTSHLILELYAQGNIILADADYNVLTLLRSHRDDDGGLVIMANRPYPVDQCRPKGSASLAGLAAAVRDAEDSQTLKGLAEKLVPYGPAVVTHALLAAGLKPGAKLGQGRPTAEQLAAVERAVLEFEAWLEGAGDRAGEGRIVKKQTKPADAAPGAAPLEFYDSYEPFALAQHAERPQAPFATFDEAVDEFYSKLEKQRVEAQRNQQEKQVLSKLEKVKSDQERRVKSLEAGAANADMHAALIEYNADEVDQVIRATNEAVATGMSWNEIKRMIDEEKRAGNPVAGAIASLQLERNQITVLLFYEDAADADAEVHKVPVDLGMTAHANARSLYTSRKQKAGKQQRTIDSHNKALKQAEKSAKSQLAQVKLKSDIQLIRKPFWFEKFNWFITSENYLVVSGRDAQQNEQLVKRYMSKGDIYVHADLHGASSCILKNPDPEKAVTPVSLAQAGTFCVCRSSAWDAKIVTSAWWVYHDQVSKTAPTGEYLTTGSFMVRGKKNFLPPMPLIMGFGVLFKLDDISIAAHRGERSAKAAQEDAVDGAAKQIEALAVADEEAEAAAPGEAPGEGEAEGLVAAPGGTGPGPDEEEAVAVSSSSSSSSSSDGEEDDALDVLDAPQIGIGSAYSKYGLQAAPQAAAARAEAAEPEPEGESAPVSKRKYLTAKQRRDLKKGKDPAQEAEQDEDPQARAEREALEAALKAERERVAQKKKQRAEQEQKKKVRGKNKKLKKIKAKYADQDEDDRRMAMELLQSEGKKAPAGALRQKEAEAAEVPRDRSKAPPGPRGNGATKGAREPRPAPEEDEEIKEFGTEKLGVVDSLTALPREDDVLLFAIPVCAAYSCMQTYKYKAKLTPGSGKRGKAAKQAIDFLVRNAGVPQREKDMIKAIADNELVAAMIGNVKVSMPGFAAAKSNAKKNKKQKAKAKG